jgi:hypothetical protein
MRGKKATTIRGPVQREQALWLFLAGVSFVCWAVNSFAVSGFIATVTRLLKEFGF